MRPEMERAQEPTPFSALSPMVCYLNGVDLRSIFFTSEFGSPDSNGWIHQLWGFSTGICSFIICICLTGTIRELKSEDACLGTVSVLYPDHTFRLGRNTVMYKALVDLTLRVVFGESNC